MNVKSYDIVFIDGLHTADQVYKDITNATKYLNPGGFIVVHDVNPQTSWHTRPVEEYKRGEEWNGSTYQGYIRFINSHPQYHSFTVDTDYGVGIISERKLNKSLGNDYWDFFDKYRVDLLRLISKEKFQSLF